MSNSLRIICLSILAVVINFNFAAAETNPFKSLKPQAPVEVDVALEHISTSDDKLLLNLTFDLPDGWKMYGENPGDLGLPTTIDLSDSKNIESYEVEWPAPEMSIDEIMGEKLKSFIYKGYTAIPISIDTLDSKLSTSISGVVSFGVCKEVCIGMEKNISLSIAPNQVVYSAETDAQDSAAELPLLLIFAFAVIGGLILNVMPCVLPVLSLKLLNVVKYAGFDRKEITINLLAATLGILLSFLLLAAITVGIKSTGKAVGWGFHFQEPGFLIFLIVVLVLFASNLWGDFELKLPQFLSDIINDKPDKQHSINNSILTGAFATLLATPCTAPFLTTSVAFALSQNNAIIFFIYFAIGLGMSLPYLVIATFPRLIAVLPKPGEWMLKLKKLFSVLLILTAVWLLYVLTFQTTLQTVLVLAGAIIILKFVLYEQQYIKSTLAKILLISLTIVAVFAIPMIMEKREIAHKQAMDSKWEVFDQTALDEYITQGRTVLIDVTAEWCLICKTNKLLVLEQEDVLEFLAQNDVVLMRADYTNKSKEIAAFLVENNRYGIPLNIVYGPKKMDGIILPELLSKEALATAVKDVKN